MSDVPYPIAINYKSGTCIFSDDAVHPVTNWIGEDGEECDPQQALSCVTGEEGYGWYTIDLTSYILDPVH